MCSRKGKTETVEVCLIYVMNHNVILLLSYWSFFSERVGLNGGSSETCGASCVTRKIAPSCVAPESRQEGFPPSASLPLFLCVKWTGLFPNELKTEQDSLVFVKRMVAVAVSSITYLRGIFPEEAYRSRYLEGEAERRHHVAMVNKYCVTSPIFVFYLTRPVYQSSAWGLQHFWCK